MITHPYFEGMDGWTPTVSGGGAFTDQQVNGAKSRGASRGGGSATRSTSGGDPFR